VGRAAVTTTVRFDYTGASQTFVVPTGVTSLHVVAIGGRGGDNGVHSAAGGRAAMTSGDVPVTAGPLTVTVGGNGADAAGTAGGAGGFNGGGAGGSSAVDNGNGAGGGGGASSLFSDTTPLLIAAGGAGAGGDYGANDGGAGGDAKGIGQPGGGPDAGGAGGPGTPGSPGTGGAPSTGNCGSAGDDGTSGMGGGGGGPGAFGAGGPGGGGGGGLNGGGGGASGCNGSSGGGGGGGASFTDASVSHVVASLDNTGVPSITISYVSAGPVAGATPSPIGFGTVPQGVVSAPQTITVTNTGAAPLTVAGVSFTGTGAGDYLVDATACTAPVAPGSGCPVVVRFAPQAEGDRSATMQISSDGGTPAVSLTGTGGPLPQGPPGSSGAQGPTGGTGPTAQALAVILASASYTGKAGSRLTLRYATTVAGTVTAELVRHGHIVLRSQVSARAGRDSIRIAHLPKSPGRYKIELIAQSTGQAAADTASLVVTKAHQAKTTNGKARRTKRRKFP
jgi:hypothetical protein